MLLLFLLIVFSVTVYVKGFKELKKQGANKGEMILFTIVLMIAVVLNGMYFLDLSIVSPLVLITKLFKPISKILYL